MFSLVVANTAISPEYFKNEMTWNELNKTLEALDDKIKSGFEQTRLLMHSIYQVNSSKKLKPTDIIKFAWDEEAEAIKPEKIMSKEDAERLINMKR